jgi:hypothetical protein
MTAVDPASQYDTYTLELSPAAAANSRNLAVSQACVSGVFGRVIGMVFVTL